MAENDPTLPDNVVDFTTHLEKRKKALRALAKEGGPIILHFQKQAEMLGHIAAGYDLDAQSMSWMTTAFFGDKDQRIAVVFEVNSSQREFIKTIYIKELPSNSSSVSRQIGITTGNSRDDEIDVASYIKARSDLLEKMHPTETLAFLREIESLPFDYDMTSESYLNSRPPEGLREQMKIQTWSYESLGGRFKPPHPF